ncbi:host nuclease inhibitor protein [Pseudomonas tohonis]|uniref:host nuclease inhibitor protein n=1 Tax=Pseudomonas tohonis TaxID=2725477 RepID=UPI001F4405A9|nr:host nuclease inhibitor protein [Pseudomonas tohonis]
MTISIETIMEQAQVYASAWSLVGSRFDNGGRLEQCEEEKRALRAMLEEFLSEPNNIAIGLVQWHKDKMANLQAVIDAPADTEIRIDGEPPIVITGEQRKGFRAGLLVAQGWFSKFPLAIEVEGDQEVSE